MFKKLSKYVKTHKNQGKSHFLFTFAHFFAFLTAFFCKMKFFCYFNISLQNKIYKEN